MTDMAYFKSKMKLASFHAAIISVGLLKLVYANSLSEGSDFGELIFVNVLYRHGDRTPLDPYPNDPYKNVSYWPVGFGQLTNVGKEQEYELGLWLRKRYDFLLTEEYSPDNLYVQSTDVDRTLMSAASVLAGLYPPTGKQRWNPHLDWQPIPIHTIAEKNDKLLSAVCPAYIKEYEKVLQSQEIQDLNRKFSNVYKVLNEHSGRNITNLVDIEYMYNTLYIEALNNFSLPTWTKDVFPQPMEEASKYSFALPTWTLKLARLKSGLLVQDMISHMKDHAENKQKPRPKMWMYSAHDTTIANLLNTLGVFELQNPPYSSIVLMELRADSSGNHHVLLYYRNSSQHEPYLLTLPGCTPACSLDQFIVHCEPVIPKDWDKECHSASLFGVTSPLPYNSLTVAALVISSLLILLLVISMIFYWQKRKQPTHCHRFAHMFLLPWDGYKPFLPTSNIITQ